MSYRACFNVLEVISWWLELGLLILLLISSKLINWVHRIEIIAEEHIRVYRWVSVEAGMGLGKWVFEVLVLSCGSVELVDVGFWFPVGWQLAFLRLRSLVCLWVDVKPVYTWLACHVLDLKSLWCLDSTLFLHRLHSVLETGVHRLGQAALCTVETSSLSAYSKSWSIPIFQRLLSWRVTLMKPSSTRICLQSTKHVVFINLSKFLVHTKLPLAGSKEATVGIQPPRCLN